MSAAGAQIVAFYGDGQGQERVTHQWLPNGPQVDPTTVDTFCYDCSNCEVGKGIRSMSLQAAPGRSFSAFALSQAYNNAACGPGCADRDKIFWVGLSYSCVEVGRELLGPSSRGCWVLSLLSLTTNSSTVRSIASVHLSCPFNSAQAMPAQ